MKRPAFLIAATAGLICGLCLRYWTVPRVSSSLSGTVTPRLILTASPVTLPQPEWQNRIADFMTIPSAATTETARSGPLADADTARRLLFGPAGIASIWEGIAQMNSARPDQFAEYENAIFNRWAKAFPEEALEAAKGLKHSRSRVLLVWNVFGEFAKSDDIGAMNRAMSLPGVMMRSAALQGIADHAPRDRIPDLLKASMQGIPDWQMAQVSFQRSLFKAMAKTDAGAPLRLALGIEDPAWRTALMQTAFDIPAQMNPEGPVAETASVLTLASDARNTAAIANQTGGLFNVSPEEGVRVFAAIPEGLEKQHLLRGVLGGGLSMVARWNQIEGTRTKFEDWQSRLNAQGQSENFKEALLDAAVMSGPEGLKFTSEWLASRDAAAVAELSKRAAEQMPYSTARWLSNLPPSAERDRAVAVFAETHAAVDLERAAAWAESIADPAIRNATLTSIRRSAE